jgi:RNA polymerase sigma factor (TIGR02999 family)
MIPDSQPIDPATQPECAAAGDLLPLIYDELRNLAMNKMYREASGQTLQPTALVHEAWLRLAGNNPDASFANRAHFFAAAAEAMRRILIDRARRKSTDKRGGNPQRVDLDHVELAAETESDTLLMVSDALDRLASHDAKAAEIVNLRFFAGLTLEQAGEVMGCSERTAKRYWSFARAWLYDDLQRTMDP